MLGTLAAWTMRRPSHQTLIFHRVVREPDPMSPSEPTAAWFESLIAMLKRRFDLIGVAEAVRRAQEGLLNGRTLSITFDDGYADNFEVALPILKQHGAPATFFVASGFLDGGRMWNDSIIETCRRLPPGRHETGDPENGPVTLDDWESRRAAASRLITAWKHLSPDQRQRRVDGFAALADRLPDDLMMTTEQLRRMASTPGITIGGHTVSHPILAALAPGEARDEIEGGKHALEEKLQIELDLFAYPNGKHGADYLNEHAEMVRDVGFRAAVATNWGRLTSASDVFRIPRFTPWHADLDRFCVDLARCHFGLL